MNINDLAAGPSVSAPVIEFSDDEVKVDRGTFCGPLGKPLATSICPLPEGSCMWAHRQTKACKFVNTKITSSEFAARVGLPALDGATLNVLRATLKNKVYKDLTR